MVVVVDCDVVEDTVPQPTGSPSQSILSAHISFCAPRTGHSIFSAVASPAHEVPGLLGSQDVHSQKPKFPMVALKTTMLGFPVESEPYVLAALKQQASEFHLL